MPSSTDSQHGSLSITSQPDVLARLESLPELLRSGPSCFQSPEWLTTWVQTANGQRPLVTWQTTEAGIPASYAVLGRRKLRRLGFIGAESLWLWETGEPLIDRLSIEYNQPLAAAASADVAVNALVECFDNDNRFDELYVSGAFLQDSADVTRARRNSNCEVIARTPTYWLDLAAIRAKNTDILGSLSANTRSQVRRAIRKLEQSASLVLEFAAEGPKCLEWFDAMRPMHEARWRAASREGAFVNPVFETFHTRLIREYGSRFVRMARLMHGDRPVAYQYYLLRDRRVYSYQSAFVADLGDKQIKPGLVGHVLAAQQLLEQGFDVYDLMAGHSQYKESLATDVGEMVWLRWQKRRLRFRLEAQARALYRRVRASFSRR